MIAKKGFFMILIEFNLRSWDKLDLSESRLDRHWDLRVQDDFSSLKVHSARSSYAQMQLSFFFNSAQLVQKQLKKYQLSLMGWFWASWN